MAVYAHITSRSAYGTYLNDLNDVVGHEASDVSNWLIANPTYDGSIWFDNGDGGDHIEVTEFFFPEEDEDEASISEAA